jgi:hypothetical protein
LLIVGVGVRSVTVLPSPDQCVDHAGQRASADGEAEDPEPAVAVQALGLVGWCLLAGVLLTSRTVVSRILGLCGTAASTPSAPYRSQAAQLSTPALLQAWRASLLSLARARTSTAKAAVVARRRAYLDELESRDPEGVRRWLDSGAGPGGDPSRYLTRRPDEPA